MKGKIIIANWKMNPGTAEEAKRLLSDVLSRLPASFSDTLVIAPPFVFLDEVHQIIDEYQRVFGASVFLGAQDTGLSQLSSQTGEVSSQMLVDSGVSCVIIGHSERRRLFNESDEVVAQKVFFALQAGLSVVVCVGESKEVRIMGQEAVMDFLRAQITVLLDLIKSLPKEVVFSKLFIAYEPIWAIGSDENDSVEDVVLMVTSLKLFTGLRVIYGGSVDSSNASEYLRREEVSGLLVGGASLKPQEFLNILTSVS